MQVPVSDWVPIATVNLAAGVSIATTNWTGLESGKNYEWYAAVTDGVTPVGSSPRRFVTATGAAPTVQLTAPANLATYQTPATVNLSATAADSDGSVVRVEFYAEGIKIGEDTTAPYTATWTGGSVGTYRVTAVAVDNAGNATLSAASTIQIGFGDFPPTVSLTSPLQGTVHAAPATLTLTANANDPEGPVARVEFYSGTTLLGTDTTAPFSWTLTGVGPGPYRFTAKATDSAGQTVTSETVTVSVYTEPAPPSSVAPSVGLFTLPTWTVARTSPSPFQFNNPGTNVGDVELRINGASVPFASGIALSSNWNDPATNIGISSDDNINQPYADASGNLFVSVLDNSNNNAAGSNPSTSEQTSSVAAVFLPYAAGWTGASVVASGVVTSGNLPSGVAITRPGGSGLYRVDGLSTAGNLIAVTNGDTGTLADNVVSVRVENGSWVIDTRDNASTGQDNDFSFVYIPPATSGVYAGLLSSTGTVSAKNAALEALGVNVVAAASYYEITFGDGSRVNPTTAALFLTGDSTIGGTSSISADNLISWSASGNAFRIFTQDLPEIDGTFEAIALRFVAIPFAATKDSDGDGIPDAWETLYGLNPFLAADALLDLDRDGVSNRDEYILGTNGAASDRYAFEVTREVATGHFQVRYATMTNRTYRIWYSNDLVTWNPATVALPGTGSEQVWTDDGSSTGGYPPAGGRRFYEVRVTVTQP
jgi:hypothetical protein